MKPNPWQAFWETVIRFQADKVTPGLGLRNALGIALSLFAGIALGAVSAGVVMCTGALNVAFSDSSDPYHQRAQRMLIASVLVGIAVFVGATCGNNGLLATLVASAWGFAAGMLVVLGSTAADIGVISLVTLVVFSAQPMPPERAFYAGLLALVGGLLQTVLAIALWPVRRFEPEHRALGDLYQALSRAAAAPIEASDAPPATDQITQAQLALSSLDQDHSIESERHRLLLSQAERIRVSLIALTRLRARLKREAEGLSAWETLDRMLTLSSLLLDSIGGSIRSGETINADPAWHREMQLLADTVRNLCWRGGDLLIALLKDADHQVSALAGQLRSATDLAAQTTPAGLKAFERREAERPWRLRLSGRIAKVRANLNLGSGAFRHATRLAICLAIGDGLARNLHWERPYWVPMTIAIVLKPDFAATFSRGVLRLAGTLAGLLLATGLFHILPSSVTIQGWAVVILALILRCFGPANYGILVTAVTALVVFLIAVSGVAPGAVVSARGLNTLAGGAIALAGYAAWPTWERSQVSEALAELLEAYRGYFRTLREAYFDPETLFTQKLDATRLAGRLARSNLEASIDRAIAEPGAILAEATLLSAILASSHRLAHAMMALEADLMRSGRIAPRQPFLALANHIELTLYSLSAALRGSPLQQSDLPDLREDHQALLESGDSLMEQYALMNVETDRMTNSLNTLSGEVLQWIAIRRNGTVYVQKGSSAGTN